MLNKIVRWVEISSVIVIMLISVVFWMNSSHVKKIDIGKYRLEDRNNFVYEINEKGTKGQYTILEGYCKKKDENLNVVNNYLVVEKEGRWYGVPTEMVKREDLNEIFPEYVENGISNAGFIAVVKSSYYIEAGMLYMLYNLSDGTQVLVEMR